MTAKGAAAVNRADAIKNEIECVDLALRGHGLPTYSAMREQRDELLAAGEAVLADCGDCDTESRLTLPVGRQLRDAIDKALS